MSPCMRSGERSEEQIASDIVGFLDGSLAGAERHDFEAHLEPATAVAPNSTRREKAWNELARPRIGRRRRPRRPPDAAPVLLLAGERRARERAG